MKTLISFFFFALIASAGFATTVTVNASSTGTTTTSTKTAGTIVVNNGTNRGYAVFNLASAGIPAAATITSVKLIFTYTVSGSGNPTRTIYGYAGDISTLNASSLYSNAVTSNTMYTASWGNSATTKTMSSTAGADTFIQRNHTNTVSITWVESGASRNYTITGGTSPKLQIIYTCVAPTSVSITAGTNPICSGSSETFTGNATGGATYNWSGPNGFSSTLRNPSAFTTGTASAGIYTFTATSACNLSTSATLALAVKTAPGTTTGVSSICVGSSTTLSNAGIGGTWSSSNTGTATVNPATGVVTSVAAGSVNITYATGCNTNAVFAMTVVATPATIGGASVVCQGATTTLTNTVAGGTWSTSAASIASVNASGIVTGVGAGTATISYVNSCGTATKTITVGIAPAAISGSSTVCAGASVTLSNTVTGGTWSTSQASKVSIDATTGVMTGVATGGSPSITYSTGCGTNASLSITVNASPNAIGGATSVCTAANTTLTNSTTAGAWSSSNTSLATISTGGVVYGLSQGQVTISYTKTGCSALSAFTVKTTPAAIGGTGAICSGTTATLTNTSIAGTWTTSAASITSVNASGLLTAVASGSATITYSTGCGTNATSTETVNSMPAAISGAATVCTGASTTLTDGTNGGTWSSSNSALATISTGGVVTGRTQGTVTITYAISSCRVTTSILVKAAPSVISGTTAICNGATSALSNTSGNGTWSTSNAAVASVNTSGLVMSVAPGTATVNYSTGCGTDATATVSVGLAPAAISGVNTMCSNSAISLTEAVSGGTWSSSNGAVASVNTSGVVYGLSAGNAIISYALTNGCGANVVTQAIAVSQTGLWLGTSSSDWTDAANWPCGTIPDASIDVVIPSGTAFVPDFSGATFDVHNLTVSAGVELPISSDAIVSVHGNLTNNGVINGDGVVEMKGSSAQVIYGKGTCANLTINNTSGVAINAGDSVKVLTDLTLTLGTLTTNNGLRLVSNVLGTARIAPVTGGAISGNVNIEQYFEGGRRAYRFFAHPFNSSIALSMIGANLDVTGVGGAGNGFTTTGSNAPSTFRYNPLVGNSSLSSDPGWKAFTNANATTDTNEFKQYQGIRLFVRGAKGEGLGYIPYTPSAATISMKGNVNTGTQVVTLHKGLTSDYNQVGNPYPSPTNIGAVIANGKLAGQVAGSAFFVWNPFLGSAGAFETKVIGGAYVIAQNSSFQVRAVNDGSTLTFSESNKATAVNETLLRDASAAQFISLKVVDGNNHPWDMMYLSFNDNATANEDVDYDATKALNPDLNFYTYTGNTKFAVDARPYSSNVVIPVGITTNYAQRYTIKAENIVLPAGAALYLHDKMLNQYVLLENGAAYSFDITSDKATQGENRFELTANNGTSVAAANGLNVAMSPNPATDKVTVAYTTDAKAATIVSIMNVAGTSVITRTLGDDASGKVTISLSELPAGIYMVEVTSGSSKKTQKLVKE